MTVDYSQVPAEELAPNQHRQTHTRRTILSGIGAVTGVSVAGCLGTAESPPEAAISVALDDGKSCDVCGMIIADHYGPNGQAFYDGHPPDRDGPAWYDSVHELLSDRDVLETRVGGPTAVYVTDYSTVEYRIEVAGGDNYISTHVAADSFTDATQATFVVDSGILGAMGPDFIPFSESDDAAAFQREHGGERIDWQSTVEFDR